MMVVDLHRWTVRDYHRMAELGLLEPDAAVELVDGQILNKPMKGSSHSAAAKRTEKLLERCLSDRVLVRLQDPIFLNEYSEPEPDIAVVRPDPLFYERRHPVAEEVYLIIEIADTSVSRDVELKSKVYARAKIAEYWVLNLRDRQLHVFREPTELGYQTETVLNASQTLSLLAFPEIAIAVREILPSAIA